MRFLLALLLVFSVVIDDCTASSLLGTDTSDVQRKSTADCYAYDNFTEKSDKDESHQSESHAFCKHCPSCQHIMSGRISEEITDSDSIQLETPYQFFIPSTFIKSLKRPPKV